MKMCVLHVGGGAGITSQAAETCCFERVPSALHELASASDPIRLLEGGPVHEPALQRSGLADEALQQHPNGHARGEGVRIDYQIRPADSNLGFLLDVRHLSNACFNIKID
jgi:hypothetical protein